jgi:tetratricopeptide (TPR) repeat protein
MRNKVSRSWFWKDSLLRRRKRLIILIGSHLLAVGIGLGAAFLWFDLQAEQVLKEGNAMMTQAAIISRYALFLDAQRAYASREDYREALKRYLAAVDEAAKQPSSFLDQKILASDKALTYERLARLERDAGNYKDAEDYMKSAVEACGNTAWKDCSPENISRISKKLEEYGFSSKSKDSTNKK